MRLDVLAGAVGAVVEHATGSAADGSSAAPADPEITGVSFDSRRVEPGHLFCCVPGDHTDGHDHAPAAIESGAVALLVEHRLDVAVPQVVVESVRHAMGVVAAAFYGDPSGHLRLVGVTGTNGKTTTSFMVESILEAAGMVTGLTGTVETHVAGAVEPVEHTTPEGPDVQRLLARMVDAGCDAAVMEVSSHALDQGRVDGTHFACTAFTNLTQDHLDYHSTMEAYFAAKARLFDPGWTSAAVVNIDDPWGDRLATRITDASPQLPLVRVAAAGEHKVGAGADVAVTEVDLYPARTRFQLRTPAGQREVSMRLGGSFNVANAVVAAGVAHALGIDLDATIAGLQRLDAVPGRFEQIDAGQEFTVLVDYADTPDGVENVLQAARAILPGDARLLCVVGCGGDRDRTKRPLMGRAAALLADHVVITSDNPRTEDPDAIIAEILPGVAEGAAESGSTSEVEPDRRLAIRRALQLAEPDDIVVVAGKGHETGQEINHVRYPFDDRVVVAEELRELGAR